jgi:hypothetical protein
VAIDGQVAKEELHFRLRSANEVLAGFHRVEANVSADPITIALLGSDGVVLETHDLADLLEELELELGVGND